MQWHCFHITRSTSFHSSPALNRSSLRSSASKAAPSPLCLWGRGTNWKVLLNVAWFGTQGLEIPPRVKTRLQGVGLSIATMVQVHMPLYIRTHAQPSDILVRMQIKGDLDPHIFFFEQKHKKCTCNTRLMSQKGQLKTDDTACKYNLTVND